MSFPATKVTRTPPSRREITGDISSPRGGSAESFRNKRRSNESGVACMMADVCECVCELRGRNIKKPHTYTCPICKVHMINIYPYDLLSACSPSPLSRLGGGSAGSRTIFILISGRERTRAPRPAHCLNF